MQFKDISLDLTYSASPKVMGILNVTPDSFSDGGRFSRLDDALAQARLMLSQGASILDVGGESTRPGAQAVTEQQELDRVIPVIEKIHAELDVVISIDTSKSKVMSEAVTAGASLINDVMALQAEEALVTAAKLDVPVCLMHMQGEPRTMQSAPQYENVVQDVYLFLSQRRDAAINAGISADKIILDPGFGFGKQLQHNQLLMKHLTEFKKLDAPILVGVSRKSMIGEMLNVEVDQRVFASVSMATLAMWMGASIIRAHDIEPTVQALTIVNAIQNVEED